MRQKQLDNARQDKAKTIREQTTAGGREASKSNAPPYLPAVPAPVTGRAIPTAPPERHPPPARPRPPPPGPSLPPAATLKKIS